MKKLFLAMIFLDLFFFYAQEETLDDFFKISQENLKKYSLAKLAGTDFLNNKEAIEYLKKVPNSYLFLTPLSHLSETQAKTLAQFNGKGICLNGLEELTDSTTKFLPQFHCEVIYLNGIKLDDQVLLIINFF